MISRQFIYSLIVCFFSTTLPNCFERKEFKFALNLLPVVKYLKKNCESYNANVHLIKRFISP